MKKLLTSILGLIVAASCTPAQADPTPREIMHISAVMGVFVGAAVFSVARAVAESCCARKKVVLSLGLALIILSRVNKAMESMKNREELVFTAFDRRVILSRRSLQGIRFCCLATLLAGGACLARQTSARLG